MTFSDLIYLLPVCFISLLLVGLFWWIFGWLLAHSLDRNLRRCPECKRGGVGKIVETEIEPLGVKVDRSKLTTIRIKREKVTDHYICDHCGHQWTRSFTRQNELPVQKASSS
jgi:hypothetical protein